MQPLSTTCADTKNITCNGNTESKTEFANNSLNSPKQGNCFRVGIRVQGDLIPQKTPDQKSHATVPLI